jgi:transmembrane sensor
MTDEQIERIVHLLTLRRENQLTVESELELQDWAEKNLQLYGELTDDQRLKEALQEDYRSDHKVLSMIKSRIPQLNPGYQAPLQQPVRKMPYGYYWAAAIVLVLATGGLTWNHFIHSTPANGRLPPSGQAMADLSPGTDRAVLRLSDGTLIALDSAHKGDIAQQGNTHILKPDNGHIVYTPNTLGMATIQYNTVLTPRGGQYQVTLPDGSHVWLNAASSLRFPTAFTTGQRIVQLTGEGYFEIAKRKEAPFLVQVGNTQVQVLGTHFDIMAYPEDHILKTTLLEGGIKITNGAQAHVLSPGQQVQLQTDGSLKVVTDPSADRAISWVAGDLQFSRDSLTTIMNQIARWYDVDIEYEGHPTQTFTGIVSRQNNASEVMKYLEESGGVHFRIDGKKIIILK